jgi:hypothetical protein
MINYNIANIELDEEFPLPNTYKITDVSFQADPYDHLPEDAVLIVWDDFDFGLEITPEFISCENAVAIVVNEANVPLYLIGAFNKF